MLHAVIMAGGSGTRFWPLSRRERPKQFLALAGEAALLRATYERILPLVPPERIWVVTTAATAELSRQLLPELPEAQVVAEPAGRDTAACVALAALLLRHRDPDAVCLVLPADHVVGEEEDFRAALAAGAAQVTAEGGLLTFGVRPRRPETGYGYLKLGPRVLERDGHAVHQLERFVEKPDAPAARAYLEDGSYLWNSGMFAWRAGDLLAEVERQLPDLAAGLRPVEGALGTASLERVLAEAYPELPRISVDFGVMEGAERRWTVPVEFPWSDVGSWSALTEVLPGDAGGNACRGRTVVLDGADNVVVGEGPVVTVAGVEGLVVVATPDAVLVTRVADAQRVKEVVRALEERGWDDVL